jgi:4-amino-4-deoxychorismate lyase
MCHLVESIRIHNGRTYLLRYHQARMNRSLRHIFGLKSYPDLKDIIQIPKEFQTGLVKCRVIYDTEIRKVTFEYYVRPEIQSFKLIKDDDISYDYKYLEREKLAHWKAACMPGQDFIIVKHGFLTDGYYYNVALEKSGKFFTPEKPLLNGVMRQYLLNRKILKTAHITPEEILQFDKIHLINAMNPLNSIIFTPDK